MAIEPDPSSAVHRDNNGRRQARHGRAAATCLSGLELELELESLQSIVVVAKELGPQQLLQEEHWLSTSLVSLSMPPNSGHIQGSQAHANC
mmetsp:Transcript_149721/g.272196  ORF Transcript_149721/g.272196 Transcript_149721/m.272196 type:complete len:91 (+) Transcript_149721:82-354(+)